MNAKKIRQWGLISFAILALLFIITASLAYRYLNPNPPYRQAYLNGKILTMDQNSSIAEAVLIERDRILAVGSNEEIRQQIDDETQMFDLEGKTMMPGVIDAHSHFPGSGLHVVAVDLNSPPIGAVTSIEQALRLLKQKAEQTPKGETIFAFGYDDTVLKEKRHFNRIELDRVSSEHPIYVMHISAHLGVANSFLLQKAGITKDTPNPKGGEIHKNPSTGELSGLLLETANNPVRDMATHFSRLAQLKIMMAASDEYISKGVTTAQNGLVTEVLILGFSMASRIGITPLRLVLWPDTKVAMRLIKNEVDFSSYSNDKLLIGAIKLVVDGSLQGYTGYLSQPYYIQPPLKAVNYRGYPTIGPKKLKRLVKDIHSAGYQLAMHGNGDAAIDLIIDAFNEAQKSHYREDARPIIVHAQMLRDDQIDRIKKLGMTPSFFIAHTYYYGDRHWNIFLGPERAKKISPAKSTLDKGVPFTLHLDTPVVPMNPMLMAWMAVHRLSTSGRVIGKEERISVMQALRAMTIDAAWQIFQENNRGSIEAGKFADLIVLSDDPLKNPEKLHNIQVEKTLIGGVPVYQRQ